MTQWIPRGALIKTVLVLQAGDSDGPGIRLTQALEREGYRVSGVSLDSRIANAADLLAAPFGGRPPDILLADLRLAADCLPVQHARRVLNCVWGEDLPMPLILALFQPRHIVLPDWRAYVDDFLLPPHTPEEILARLSLLLFRKRFLLPEKTIVLPGITIHVDSGQIMDRYGETVPVTPREWDLLKFLASHRGKFFSRARLLDLVWGIDFEGGERTVDIHIRRLRAKLPAETAALLETRRSVGYGIGAA